MFLNCNLLYGECRGWKICLKLKIKIFSATEMYDKYMARIVLADLSEQSNTLPALFPFRETRNLAFSYYNFMT